MAIAIRGSVSTADSAGTPVHPQTLDLPATIEAGDVILVWMHAYLLANGQFFSTDPTSDGFTRICDELQEPANNNTNGAAYYKVAAGTEDGATLTWARDTGTFNYYAAAVVLTGVDTASVIDVCTHATHHDSFVDDLTPAFPAITTVTDGAWVFHAACANMTHVSVDTDLSGAVDLVNHPGDNPSTYITYYEKATAGAVNAEFTYTTGDAGQDGLLLAFAVKPAATGLYAAGVASVSSILSIVGGSPVPVLAHHYRMLQGVG